MNNMELVKQISSKTQGLNALADLIYFNNREKGFWDNERNVGELFMLVVSELGEAMEAHRKKNFAYKKAKTLDELDFEKDIKDSFEDEIADAIIRLLDMSSGLGLNIEDHIRMKLIYNLNRPRLHGKSY